MSDKEAMKSALRITLLLLLTVSMTLSARGPEFGISTVSDDDRLLFTCDTFSPGNGDFRTLFVADLSRSDYITTLTHYPERTRSFRATGEIEIQNRFGLYRLSLSDGDIREPGYVPSFADGDDIPVGRFLPVSSSPDGRWTIVQEPMDGIRGLLVIYNNFTGGRTEISRGEILDYRNAPVQWSPDSRFLLYERDGRIYYASLRHVAEDRLPHEAYREFGRGTLNALRWNSADSLIHIEGSVVTRIRPSEFFTGAFYLDPLPVGSSTGTIPLDFNPVFDRFWPSPEGDSLMVLTGERNLFLFPADGQLSGSGEVLPYLLLPEETALSQIWWRRNGDILILAGSGSAGTSADSRLYRMNRSAGGSGGFERLSLENILRFAPSPEGDRLVLVVRDGLRIVDSGDFSELDSFTVDGVRDATWLDSSRLLVSGETRLEILSLESRRGRLLTLSSVDSAGFDRNGRLQATSGGAVYLHDPETGHWRVPEESEMAPLLTPRTESPNHRVYLEPSDSVYTNLIRIRKTDGFGNRNLFGEPPTAPVPLDEEDSADAEEGIFSHGSRTRSRQMALVFNAVNGDEGLDDVLALLDAYGIRSTFFVSGDFIRRHPGSARDIAASPHEIGSLFYTHMDMTDYRFLIDSEFVIRGLGRNEDEFFRTTGREITTLWHAPWYVVSPAILEATAAMNYSYIGRDVDPQDWISLDGDAGQRILYRRNPEILDQVLREVRPGSIVPIRIGRPGGREDYFYRKLDLLINNLLKSGYEIVTVGTLRENSR